MLNKIAKVLKGSYSYITGYSAERDGLHYLLEEYKRQDRARMELIRIISEQKENTALKKYLFDMEYHMLLSGSYDTDVACKLVDIVCELYEESGKKKTQLIQLCDLAFSRYDNGDEALQVLERITQQYTEKCGSSDNKELGADVVLSEVITRNYNQQTSSSGRLRRVKR